MTLETINGIKLIRTSSSSNNNWNRPCTGNRHQATGGASAVEVDAISDHEGMDESW